MPVSQLPQAPYRQDRKTFPTPIVGDVLFSEVRDGNRLDLPAYGTPHPNTKKWPDHKLVYIKPVDIERNEIFEFFYAAEREDQDLYNFSFGYRNIIGNVGGREFRVVQRSYVTLRDKFEPLDIPFGTPMPDVPEDKFEGVEYVFFDRQQQRIDQQELDSLFVSEVHTYVEKSFLDLKLSYTKQKPNPLPDKFRVASTESTEEQIVTGLASPPTLSGLVIEARESQLNPDVKLVTSTARTVSVPTSFSQQSTTNSKQLATVTETLQNEDTLEEPTALIDIESQALGDGTYVVRKTEVPELFTEQLFSVDTSDVIPEKFKAAIPSTVTESNSIGEATTPTLGESDIQATEQQVNKFVKRTRRVSRDLPDSGVTVKNVDFDNQTGRGSRVEETVYRRGSSISGYGVIENLFADPTNAFWGQRSDSSFFVGEQLSDDWFLVKKQFAAAANSTNTVSNPAKKRFIQRVTPLGTDFLFYEVGTISSVPPAYGTAHYDNSQWPNHKLIFISPEGDSGTLYRFYYAADRENQDLYNFVDEQGNAIVRSYIIPREDYLNRQVYNLNLPEVGVSPDPLFGVSDPVYGSFVFASENVQKAPEPLDTLYVVIEHVYLLKERKSVEFNNNIERSIEVTKTIIKRGSTPTVSNSVGVTVEVENVNTWYDIQTVSSLANIQDMFDNGKFIPIRLPDIPKDVNYEFPNKLNSVDIKYVSVYHVENKNGSTSESYDDAFYFDYDLQSPPTGPYSAKLIRFITDDPQSIKDLYPVVNLHPKRETVGLATTSTIAGNARAIAQQIELPSSIHGPIDITINGTDVDSNLASRVITPDLPISADYFSLMAGGDFIAGYEVSKTVLNLYEVSVVVIDITDLYSGVFTTSTTGQQRRKHSVGCAFYAYVEEETTGTFIRSYLVVREQILDVTSVVGSKQITYPETRAYLGIRSVGVPQPDYSSVIAGSQSKAAVYFANKLQKDKELSGLFVFDSEDEILTATCLKQNEVQFSMRINGWTSATAFQSYDSTSTLITI